jgi:hypothetical protein
MSLSHLAEWNVVLEPPGAGDGKGDLGQAAIGGAVPGKALIEDHYALGLAVPLPHQDGPGLEAVTGEGVALCREFVAIAGSPPPPGRGSAGCSSAATLNLSRWPDTKW